MKPFAFIDVLVLLILASLACGDTTPVQTSAPSPSQTPTETPTAPPTPSPTRVPYPTPVQNSASAVSPAATVEPAPEAGEIEWSPCGPGLECGFVEVPADYRDPESGSISIAVNVQRATSPDARVGYLLVNPGGPGESGVELVSGAPFGAFSEEVVAHFDIVGFDPRGVGESDPSFACGAPGEQLALLATIDGPIDEPDEMAAGEAAADLCIESMGPVGGLLHSAYVARDMDEIRKALGVDQISYLGFSYGSALGVWYATLFPGSVRAMVVDGADNPIRPVATQRKRIEDDIESAQTFSIFLERALQACSDSQCPIYNDGDPVSYFLEAVGKLHLVNAAADDHPLAGALGVISTLYSEETWPDLWNGLYELNEYDDPFILLDFAGFQLGPEPGAASFTSHVNCLDDWALHPELDRATRLDDMAITEAATEEMFPLLAALDASLPEACPFYDRFVPEPLDSSLNGGGVPILVVGNHDDPFTAFRESEELATETLENGYLVETSHPTHVVYPNNKCVLGHVHTTLIDGIYPDERRVSCERES